MSGLYISPSGDPTVLHKSGRVVAVNGDGTLDIDVGPDVLLSVETVATTVTLGDRVKLLVWKNGVLALTADSGGGSPVPQWMTDLAVRPDGTPHADDDEFDGASLNPVWTAVTTAGTATWSQEAGLLAGDVEGQASNKTAALLRPITSPAAPMTIATVVVASGTNTATRLGLMFTDGTDFTSHAVACDLNMSSGETYCRAGDIEALVLSPGSVGAAYGRFIGRLYLRLEWVAANTWQIGVSPTGTMWRWLASPASYTMTPTHFGVYGSTWGASGGAAIVGFEYFRVYES